MSSCRASASVTVGRLHADEAPRCDSLHTTMTFIIRSRAMHRDNQAESERLFRKLFERSVGFATLTRAAANGGIVLIIVVVLALAVGACSTGKPCAGPYGEPCGGPRSGWPGAVTCPSC